MDERTHPHNHAVQFYETDEALVGTVGAFLSEGLIEGQPAVVIATPAHTHSILEDLSSRLIDVAEARHIGDLVCLDAEQTLATFMAHTLPDPASFHKSVGDVIEQTLAGRTRTALRAYGEMVEVLWNDLANTHPFQLLCGYSMGNFYKQSDRFEEVCQLHTHVLPLDAKLLPFERGRVSRRPTVATA